jgi:hypothetical protein
MRNLALLTATLALALCGAAPAMAATLTLLDLTNSPDQALAPYELTFVATAASSDISFAGYQLPADETVSDISLNDISTPGPNVLGQVWNLTPAASGSQASQFNDGYGTGTNAVDFAGMTLGDSDTYDQIVTTVAGDQYSLTFLFTQYNPNQNELTVSATNASPASGTPEPASMLMLGSGSLGVAIAARKRRKTA